MASVALTGGSLDVEVADKTSAVKPRVFSTETGDPETRNVAKGIGVASEIVNVTFPDISLTQRSKTKIDETRET